MLLVAQLAPGCRTETASEIDDAGTTGDVASTGTGASESTSTTMESDDMAGSESTGDPIDPPVPSWDPMPEPPACDADPDAPALVDALTQAGLTADTFGMTESDLAESVAWQNGALGGDFALSWFADARATPIDAGCLDARLAGVLDLHLQAAHPVAGMIRHLATTLDRAPDDATPFGSGQGFEAAVESLCATVGCEPAEGELPPELAAALAPVVWAMEEGIAARLAMDAEPGGDPSFWWANGGNFTLLDNGPLPSAADPDARSQMLGIEGRARLYRAASQIAFAVEDVDWARFEGTMGIEYTLVTGAGRIEIRDAGDHTYPGDAEEVLLLVDLGGDDTHLDEVAANRSAANPVSIAIDLGGQDTYAYDEVASPYDGPGLLPADVDGRAPAGANYGNYTLSTHFRQGAARNGIAMLWDLGTAGDTYRSLRGSQGAAHFGVGVLFDAGGDDKYLSEANSQGSAQFGIGLMVDAGDGNDQRQAFTLSQGFGFSGGAGVVVDGGGDDIYLCDVGDPAHGGLPVYYSPQRPGTGNTSMCQGAGFGSRNDTSSLSSLAGGVGILRDVDGNDAYDASVFAQGAGYWEGTGILSDGGGNDRYDAFWYVQGGAAHFALGMLVDGGEGMDQYDQTRPPQHMSLGAGHDMSLGVLIDGGGPDKYAIPGLSTGASNCNGVGLFIDHGGDDVYVATSDLGSGIGNISQECIGRPDAVSQGIMIDAGGEDTYTYPASEHPDFITPTEGGTWGYERFNLPTEHGGGVDRATDAGVHGSSG